MNGEPGQPQSGRSRRKRATECPFPQKDQLTKAGAADRARQLNARRYDGRAVKPYRCPAGGHHHVGHLPARKPKRGRRR